MKSVRQCSLCLAHSSDAWSIAMDSVCVATTPILCGYRHTSVSLGYPQKVLLLSFILHVSELLESSLPVTSWKQSSNA